jgi:hypothetical protein
METCAELDAVGRARTRACSFEGIVLALEAQGAGAAPECLDDLHRFFSHLRSRSHIQLGRLQHWGYCLHFSCWFGFFNTLLMKGGVPKSPGEEIDEE